VWDIGSGKKSKPEALQTLNHKPLVANEGESGFQQMINFFQQVGNDILHSILILKMMPRYWELSATLIITNPNYETLHFVIN
jgi:hypothetical protein